MEFRAAALPSLPIPATKPRPSPSPEELITKGAQRNSRFASSLASRASDGASLEKMFASPRCTPSSCSMSYTPLPLPPSRVAPACLASHAWDTLADSLPGHQHIHQHIGTPRAAGGVCVGSHKRCRECRHFFFAHFGQSQSSSGTFSSGGLRQ